MPRKDVNKPQSTDNPDEVRIYEVVTSALPFDLRENQQFRKKGEQVASVEFIGANGRTPESIEQHFVNLGAIILISTCTKGEWEKRRLT